MEKKNLSVVTGANGFVGSHLVDYLLEQNHTVRCLVRKTSDLKWLKGKNIEIVDAGLFDKAALKEVLKDADYLYHVAGVVKSKKPDGYFKGNVETTKNLLEVIVENDYKLKRVLIVGSQTTTGPSLNGQPVNEETIPNPITTYGKSKLGQEETAKKFMNKIPITIVRSPAVYGERDTEVFIFFDTFKKGLMTTIGLDIKKVSLIHVRDLVEGIHLASISDKSVGQIYFISSEEFYTWEQIGSITSKVLNKNPFKIKVPHTIVYTIAGIAQFFSMFSSKAATLNIEKARDLVQNSWTCDPGKAKRDLGYRQKISIEEGIKRTCDWYKEMKWF